MWKPSRKCGRPAPTAATEKGRGEGILPGPLIHFWESALLARRMPDAQKGMWGLGREYFSLPILVFGGSVPVRPVMHDVEVAEPGELALEEQLHRAGRAVPLLRDDQLRLVVGHLHVG